MGLLILKRYRKIRKKREQKENRIIFLSFIVTRSVKLIEEIDDKIETEIIDLEVKYIEREIKFYQQKLLHTRLSKRQVKSIVRVMKELQFQLFTNLLLKRDLIFI
ncbi:MAG: hypothetical protein KAQ87_01035 [Candidatus Pacebacteria bacterium]|nr:hypothetical protein [Candidatus Paceibacterota bacterium]